MPEPTKLPITDSDLGQLDAILDRARDGSWGHEDGGEAAVDAIACPIVAAELRRQADALDASRPPRVFTTSLIATDRVIELIAAGLRARADELDPPAPGQDGGDRG